MVIVGLVGRPGSGKTEISAFLEKNWGFEAHELPFINYRNLLVEGRELTQENLTEFLKRDQALHSKAMDICKVRLLEYEKNQISRQFEIAECIEAANFRISNFASLSKLFDELVLHRPSIERPFRPKWDTYFMKVAYAVKARSNCMKRSVGAVIMQKYRIISTGYNGTPASLKNCYEEGCARCNSNTKQGVDLHLCICIHAEESAILEAKITSMKDATIYTTLFPCSFCAKIINHVKIKRVVYDEEFEDKNSRNILTEAGIEICKLDTDKYLFNI